MNLWLLRHGEAEFRITTDAARNLTEDGEQEVLTTAQKLQNRPIDIILHSPYKRAIQTAMLVCRAIGYKGKIEEVDWITPEDNAQLVIKKLDNYQGKNILIVSHQPLLGILAALLTEGSPQFPLSLSTAELIHLEGEAICLAGMQVAK
ncbi:phosphohistidine phosphatase SixA [Entomomonas asaccharolytica]|uniref:phosphoglycerate mutase (2,3-diphosphoglycerate-dependent) n=1 Tax=Entomomonas asaccharolytica TaxID=2785331 RepID=A0A974NCU2_9GAMM|nr:phosphohistidine phosphatase SixA [Entomomonas asaccharolytica]QQP84360.1 phosphohistidine phosphatase SixA [Entomomonas asaccharolytica]